MGRTDMRYSSSLVEKNRTPLQNFIVFGEMGMGKSSLINLIAGEERAKTSPDAASCTLKSTKYEIKLPDHRLHINLYDTAGLNEPNMNGTEYLDAIVKAHELINSLKKEGGPHGLLFCIRGRITTTVQQNYRLFYEFLCNSEVPLALVITGLEGEKDDMDHWWTRNQTQVEKYGIKPQTHACITTTMGLNDVYIKKYSESRTKMIEMLKVMGNGTACLVDESSWFVRICKRLRELFAGGTGSGKGSRSPDKKAMKKVLTTRCELSKEAAEGLLQKINTKKS